MSLAQIAAPVLASAKANKVLSKGLASLSGSTKNKTLRKVFGIGSKVAGALGLAHAMQSMQAPGTRARRRQSRPRKRQANAPGVSGGTSTAGASNAPMAFARTDKLKPIFRAIQGDQPDTMIIYVVEFVAAIGVSGSGLNGNHMSPIGPQDTYWHPWLSSIIHQFERYRPKLLNMHYEHFAPTTVQGSATMQFFPDAGYNQGAFGTLTLADLRQASNFMTGAVYEDFVHNVDLSGVDRAFWFDTQATLATDDGSDNNYYGVAALYCADGAVGVTANTGNAWIEACYEVKGRTASAVTIGLKPLMALLHTKWKGSPQRRRALAHAILDDVIDQLEKREQQPDTRVDVIEEMERRYNVNRSVTTPTISSRFVQQSK